jgi:hypothetical protein
MKSMATSAISHRDDLITDNINTSNNMIAPPVRREIEQAEWCSGKPGRGAGLAGVRIKQARGRIPHLRRVYAPSLDKWERIDVSDQRREIMVLLVILQILVMIEIDNLGLTYLRVIGVYRVGMKRDGLMGVSLDAMLVLLAAVIVLRIQVRVRRHPLEHHKGGKQKKNESCVDTSLDHDSIELRVITCSLATQWGRLLENERDSFGLLPILVSWAVARCSGPSFFRFNSGVLEWNRTTN